MQGGSNFPRPLTPEETAAALVKEKSQLLELPRSRKVRAPKRVAGM